MDAGTIFSWSQVKNDDLMMWKCCILVIYGQLKQVQTVLKVDLLGEKKKIIS